MPPTLLKLSVRRLTAEVKNSLTPGPNYEIACWWRPLKYCKRETVPRNSSLFAANLCSDHFPRDDYFYSAILLATLGCAIVGERMVLTKALCSKRTAIEPLFDKVIANGIRTLKSLLNHRPIEEIPQL
jgi:hypothetical protein